MLEHVVEVVALHDHVVELQEGQALLHALLVALGAQHVVHGEAGTYLAQQLNVVQVQQPVGVVQHQRLALGEIDKLLHLLFKAGGIVSDIVLGQHLAHIGAAGGVTDHSSAAADQGDGLVACQLQALHQGQRQKMAGSQAVSGAVKADIKSSLAVVDQVNDLLIGDLGYQTTGFQFFVQRHGKNLLFLGQRKQKRPLPKMNLAEGEITSRYHLCLPFPHGSGLTSAHPRVERHSCVFNARTRHSLLALRIQPAAPGGISPAVL